MLFCQLLHPTSIQELHAASAQLRPAAIWQLHATSI
jgi:hypothetical protein